MAGGRRLPIPTRSQCPIDRPDSGSLKIGEKACVGIPESAAPSSPLHDPPIALSTHATNHRGDHVEQQGCGQDKPDVKRILQENVVPTRLLLIAQQAQITLDVTLLAEQDARPAYLDPGVTDAEADDTNVQDKEQDRVQGRDDPKGYEERRHGHPCRV